MKSNKTRKVLRISLFFVLLVCLMAKGEIALAANDTVRIYIGDDSDARQHMSMAVGGISNCKNERW